MNGFERHGITHSSASQLNKWNACQGAWVAHYLFKQRVGSVSAAMYRGICSEEGVKSVITKECSVEQAILKAQELFDQKMMFDDGSSGKEQAAPTSTRVLRCGSRKPRRKVSLRHSEEGRD